MMKQLMKDRIAARLPTPSRIKEVLHYDQETGLLTWRKPRPGIRPGTRAGYVRGDGYAYVCIDRAMCLVHRVAWAIVHGQWPQAEIDHINRDPSDNRLCNLRECTSSENKQNLGIKTNNASGYPGVSWHNQKGRWRATVVLKGRQRHVGYFDSPSDAYAAYVSAKAKTHSFHPHAPTSTKAENVLSLVQAAQDAG